MYVNSSFTINLQQTKENLVDILKHLLTDQTRHEFVMEVTDKTRADVKVIIERIS